MAHGLIAPATKRSNTQNEHHGLPAFATPMLVLFGTYLAWLLVAAIVLFIIA